MTSWTKEEDDIVLNAVTNSSDQPFTDWSAFAKVGMLPGRTGRHIRDRWVNHLNPNLWKNRVDTIFTENEDYILWEAQKRVGKKWIQISTIFFHSTRSELQIKNRWYSAAFRSFIYKQKIGSLKKKEDQDEKRMLEEMKKEDKQNKNNATETERRQRRLAMARKKVEKDENEIGQKEEKVTLQPPSRNRKRSRDRRDEKKSYDVNSDYEDDSDMDEYNREDQDEQQQQRHAVNSFSSSSRGSKGDVSSSSSSSSSSSCSSSSLPKKHTPPPSSSSSSSQGQQRPRPRRRPQPRTSRPPTVFAIDDIHVAAPPEDPTATTTTLLSASHNSNTNVEITDASTVARPGHPRRRGLPLALQQYTRQIATESRSTIEKDKGVNIGDQTTGGNGSIDRIDDEEKSDDNNSDGDDDYDDGDDEEVFFPQENNSFRYLDHKEKWMLRFQQLVAYKEQHQNTKVPYNYKENPKLGRWAYQQRSLYNRGELPSDRIDVLKSIGFVWVGIKGIAATHQIKWMNMFQELVAYKEQHQNTKVPFNSKENPKLGRWVSQQRCSYSRGELPSDRIDELNKIDFVWVGIKGIAAIDQIKWMNMFQELVAYKKQHQNTNVPAKCKENPKLGRWVAEQGKQYRKDKLILSRIDLLESIGFVWKVRKKSYNELWMERFQELVAYKKQHKNTYLPTHNDKEYPKLGSWVSKQRHHYKNDKLFPSRIDLLESIGFEWDTVRELTDQIKWMNMFQQLVAYKEQHQYTNVPCYFKENPKLGRWVSSQRMYYRKDKLIPERVAHLNSIHFDWDGTTTSKQR